MPSPCSSRSVASESPLTRGANPSALRVLPELRATHLEQRDHFLPADFFYFEENYDVRGADKPDGVRRVTLVSLLRELWGTPATVLELTEPLWVRFLPKWLVLAFWWKLSGILRHEPHRLVVYAMENNSVARLIGGSRRVPGWVERTFAWCVGLASLLTIDRLCFATPGSAATYRSMPFVDRIPQNELIDLPAPAVRARETPSSMSVTFLGVLEERKGIPALLEAWEEVERWVPDATLRVAGPGPLGPMVESWCTQRPSSRVSLGHLSHEESAQLLSTTRVLVSPSVPVGRFREQVCLPVQEALAHGVTVVSTAETGLAGWLAANGHLVVNARADHRHFTGQLTVALIQALRAPLDPGTILASLPEVGGWKRANSWLHADFTLGRTL
ncbi:hypothetical protein AS850_14180 [Frondihabitans sp. 762G35]|uniref:glycosyltransferase n=1 Tax=Frondihabitans sp. 762G35 TaxID=1446794 RepID=UPI000D220CB0|nr:glycosyltransferase [Frondihabitans sp. 762G35]ARC58229.1 hypothetical protein AS850_14180 [Frondihabitans sp. 762G35]